MAFWIAPIFDQILVPPPCAERAQRHEQMADRRSRFVAIRARGPPARAAPQMLIKETGGGSFVYVTDLEPFALYPPQEMPAQ